MRILLVSQALTPQYGGSAFSESSLSGGLIRAKDDVTVLCRQGCFDLDFVNRFGDIPVESYRAWEWIGAWLKRAHPLRKKIRATDLVHLNGHWRWENYFIARVCVSESKPYVLQPRGMLWLGHRKIWLKRIFQLFLGRYILKNAQRIVALSVFELEHWNRYGFRDSQLVVMPNGVVGAEVAVAKERATELPTAMSGYFLYLGRLESRKNLLFLISAFRDYRRRGGKAELWLVGPAERKYDEVLRKAVLRLGLTSHVRVMAPVFTAAKADLMKNSIALVYPAVEEPFGRVPFEGLDAGAFPVIPTRSGSAEYIRPFLPEAIYEVDNQQSLTSALSRLERPDTERDARREKAQDWVQQELNWERMTERYQDLYRSAVHDFSRGNGRDGNPAPLSS